MGFKRAAGAEGSMSIGLVMSGEMVGFVFKDAVAVSWFRFFIFYFLFSC